MQEQIQDLHRFDYGAPTELFPSPSKIGRIQWRYRRFDTAAEAVRFAIEEIPRPALLGAYLEVDEKRFGFEEIEYLYNNAAYPLKRAAAKG
jgi:hypothetical protein